MWPIFEITEPVKNDEPHSVLVGGGGYGGKTYLGSMLAAQYLQFPEYQCLVTRKNRKELIGPNSIWRNLKAWLTRPDLPDELRLDPRTDINKSELVMSAPSGATIWFRFFDEEESKEKLQSESYDREIHDEGPQLRPRVLKFSYRSLRHGISTCKIPLAMIILGNPSDRPQSSNEYLTENYVDGSYSYYWMDWRHNPFAPVTYPNTLNKLDFIDQKYQKDGDWHYKPAKGELFKEKTLNDAIIDKMPPVRFVRNIRGLDMAVTKQGDYTAAVKWIRDERGHAYITDVKRLQTEYPEDLLEQCILEDNKMWQSGRFETEYYVENLRTDAGVHQERYLKEFLDKYIAKGLYIHFIPPTTNKFTRARPMANAFRQGDISILKSDKWNQDFIDELKDFGPDDREYEHDDQVDGASVAYNELNNSRNGFTESKQRYAGTGSNFTRKRHHRMGGQFR